MSTPGQEFVEVFLQEASEHLQFLREYSGILQDPYPVSEDVERLYISSHTLSGSSASYGFPFFSEVASKLAHIFQYAANASIAPEAAGPLVEFISEAIAVLESDLLMISASGAESAEDFQAFKQKYPFAFPAGSEAYAAIGAERSAAGEASSAEQSGSSFVEEWQGSQAENSMFAAPAETEAALDPEAAALAAFPDLEPDAELPVEVLEFFVPETEEHLQVVQSCLLALEASPDPEMLNQVFRALHTIKGSAAQVGFQRISAVAHRAEDLIAGVRDGLFRFSTEVVDLCLETADAIRKFLHHGWPDESGMQRSVKRLFAKIAAFAGGEGSVPEASPLPVAKTASVETEAAAPAGRESYGFGAESSDADLVNAFGKREPVGLPQSKSIRISLERLDSMMNAVGELVINRTRMLGRLAELERLAEVLNFSKGRMQDKVSEFQEKHEFSRMMTPFLSSHSHGNMGNFAGGFTGSFSGGRGGSVLDGDNEFSELEMDRYDDFNILARTLTEISADITEVLTQVDGFVRRVDSDIDEFTNLAHRLQDEITQARMVQIGNLYTRISRTVRDAAKASGKVVELHLEGEETELDNNIIQQISDPLIHLVRNAVAHGIEDHGEDRYNAGKNDAGNVTVRAYHRGNHVFIEVQDDGRGIDYERVRNTAITLGIIRREEAERLGERELLELLFHPGFSTAARKTELAGRGVGLDVVRANVAALNGEIDIDTQLGVGTRFILKVPLTLIISQALFVRCAGETFAFPLAFVEEIRRVPATDLEDVGGKLLTRIRDVITEVIRLDTHLGLDESKPISGFYRMVVVNVGGRQTGIVVEDVIRKDEIVIKNLGGYLRNVRLFPGATIAPDGSLILLVDVNRLVAGEAAERRPLSEGFQAAARLFAPGSAAVAAGTIPREAIEVMGPEKVIVLADDSISVRKFVGRMLEKAGYRVELAADGLEALEIASQSRCHLVITDLEMPRTNGYELMMHMRQTPETRNIPVMVVTSRAGAKHKDRALKEGAAGFLTKPVQEDQLLEAVAGLIGSAKSGTRKTPVLKA